MLKTLSLVLMLMMLQPSCCDVVVVLMLHPLCCDIVFYMLYQPFVVIDDDDATSASC